MTASPPENNPPSAIGILANFRSHTFHPQAFPIWGRTVSALGNLATSHLAST